MTETIEGISLETFESLVPWYVSGQLSSLEQKQVKQFLEKNPEYLIQIELVKEEQNQTVASHEALGAPSAGALNKLMQDIGAETRTSLLARLNSWLEPVANWFGDLKPLVMTAAAIIIVVQMGAIGLMVSEKPGRYKTASVPQQEIPAGSYVYIRFRSDASIGDVHRFLEKHSAVVVEAPEAPTEIGMVKVRISKKKLNKEELEAVIKRLKEGSKIVENVFSAG